MIDLFTQLDVISIRQSSSILKATLILLARLISNCMSPEQENALLSSVTHQEQFNVEEHEDLANILCIIQQIRESLFIDSSFFHENFVKK